MINGLVGSANSNNLHDVYYVYMWNSCYGTKSGTNGSTITNIKCTSPKAQYYFDPIAEWGLNNTVVQSQIPKAVSSAMSAYRKGTQWMFIAYAIAFFATAATLVVGLLALCSRLGSCCTSIVSGVATLFTILAAITSTVLFSTLVGALSATLKPYRISLAVGTRMLALDWLAVAFSVAASLFWVVSICCCSGKSDRKERKSTPMAGTPFGGSRGYQPLGEQGGSAPYHNQYGNRGDVEMQPVGGAGPYKGRETAYEPFRHS